MFAQTVAMDIWEIRIYAFEVTTDSTICNKTIVKNKTTDTAVMTEISFTETVRWRHKKATSSIL
jgi:hypothetical protein